MHRVVRRNLPVWIVVPLAMAAASPWHGEALGSPARRMARRGVVVVPAPGPVVVGPRGRVRAMPFMVVPVPGPVVAVPVEPPPIAAANPSKVASAPVAVAPTAKPAPVIATPPALSPPSSPAAAEEIPAPAPVGLGRPGPESGLAAASRSDETAAFTPPWYAGHPAAWRPPQPVDVWATTDSAGLDAWLGQSVRTAAATSADAAAVATAGSDSVAPDGTRSVLVLPAGHDAPTGAVGGWLPLGVFAVAAEADSRSHSLQQLAVDRDAKIRGTFYDALSDTVQPVSGTIDRDSRTASWTVGTSGSRFEAPLEAFSNPPQTVSITSGGTTTRSWKLMRLAKP